MAKCTLRLVSLLLLCHQALFLISCICHVYELRSSLPSSFIGFMNQHDNHSIIIWQLTDGKPGHEKQTRGLVNAIAKRTAVDHYEIPVKPSLFTWVNYLAGRWHLGNHLPLPDFIIGAGHHTHIHMLAAKKAFGGKTVVLMRPSVSASLYDFALIPEHDQYQGRGNIIETRGVLNPMQPQGEHDPNRVLMLIGGPSKHYGWQNQAVIDQIKNLIHQQASKQFVLTTSRRTPADFVSALAKENLPRLSVVPVSETPAGWVEHALANAGAAWITEDSVSMVYEALSAQVAVGLIGVDKLRENRVANGVANLIRNRHVVRFDANGDYQQRMRALIGFQEADRCANQLLDAWVQSGQPLPQPLAI